MFFELTSTRTIVAAAEIAGPAAEIPAGRTDGCDSRPECRAELRGALLEGLGIVRTAEELRRAQKTLYLLYKGESLGKTDRDRVRLGLAMLGAALAREESRGAHYRADFPETKEAFRKRSVAVFDGERILIRFVSADEEGEA